MWSDHQKITRNNDLEWIKHKQNSKTVCKPWTSGRWLTDWLLSERVQSHVDLNRQCLIRCHFPPSVVFRCRHILSPLTRGTEQGFMMFKRCKGIAKALCTACQITFLMASLTGFLLSAEKERTSGGSKPFSSLSQQNHSLVHLFVVLFFCLFLYFNSSFQSTCRTYSNGRNDFVVWD